jgi:hypothetical protein
MKKIVIILVCLLLLAAGVPLFARGHKSDHGRFWKDNPHRWHDSSTHPAFHGWRGWGDAPCRREPKDKPAPEPSDKPGDDSGDKPAEEPGEKPADKGGGGTAKGISSPDAGQRPHAGRGFSRVR